MVDGGEALGFVQERQIVRRLSHLHSDGGWEVQIVPVFAQLSVVFLFR